MSSLEQAFATDHVFALARPATERVRGFLVDDVHARLHGLDEGVVVDAVELGRARRW